MSASLHKHHIYRRVNNRDETVLLCYKCHSWVHANPLLAEKEGLYCRLDGEYRPKKKGSKKWKINKGLKV